MKIAYLLGGPVALADLLAVLKPSQDLLNHLLFNLGLLQLKTLAAHAGLLLLSLKSLLHKLNILESQLLADDVQITSGVDITLDVDNLSVVKASNNLEDGIDSTDVGEERVSETSSSGRTASQTGNIVDGQVGGNDRLGLVFLNEPVESLIGHNNTSFLGLNCGVGKVLQAVSTPDEERRAGGFIQLGCQDCTL